MYLRESVLRVYKCDCSRALISTGPYMTTMGPQATKYLVFLIVCFAYHSLEKLFVFTQICKKLKHF